MTQGKSDNIELRKRDMESEKKDNIGLRKNNNTR